VAAAAILLVQFFLVLHLHLFAHGLVLLAHMSFVLLAFVAFFFFVFHYAIAPLPRRRASDSDLVVAPDFDSLFDPVPMNGFFIASGDRTLPEAEAVPPMPVSLSLFPAVMEPEYILTTSVKLVTPLIQVI
jgi:hypothetical protein